MGKCVGDGVNPDVAHVKSGHQALLILQYCTVDLYAFKVTVCYSTALQQLHFSALYHYTTTLHSAQSLPAGWIGEHGEYIILGGPRPWGWQQGGQQRLPVGLDPAQQQTTLYLNVHYT